MQEVLAINSDSDVPENIVNSMVEVFRAACVTKDSDARIEWLSQSVGGDQRRHTTTLSVMLDGESGTAEIRRNGVVVIQMLGGSVRCGLLVGSPSEPEELPCLIETQGSDSRVARCLKCGWERCVKGHGYQG